MPQVGGQIPYGVRPLICLEDEIARREQKKYSTRLRRAAFRTTKTLDAFDFNQLPNVNRALVHELATGRYITEYAPVLIVGPCGTGKSHLAQALGHCAVRQGIDVLFTTCANLVTSLNAARAVGGYERRLATLARVPLLIIDDFGLKPLRPPADEDLHELVAERYEKAATIVTSNLDLPEWDQAFPANRLLASATLDRLRHNAYCLVLDGKSRKEVRSWVLPCYGFVLIWVGASMFSIRRIITSFDFGSDSATSKARAARPTSLMTGSPSRSRRSLRARKSTNR